MSMFSGSQSSLVALNTEVNFDIFLEAFFFDFDLDLDLDTSGS
jgi:hypothetical protein